MSLFLRFFFVLFSILVLADLVILSNFDSWRWLTKPLIVISLLIYFVVRSRTHLKQESLFILGIFSALLGDIFLLWEDKFLFGLSSFLLMQIIYAIRFAKDWGIFGALDKLVISIALIVFLLSNYMLWPHLGDLRIPVIIYSLAICFMSISAFLRSKSLGSHSKVFLGTLFFIVSDCVLGIGQFVGKFPFSGIIVMLTYSIAQYLIITGMIKPANVNND